MSRRFITLLIVLVSVCPALFAQQPKAGSTSKAGVTADIAEVIRRFAAAESENKIARNNYTFTQDFDLLTIGEAGSITGRFKRVSDIVYDDRGNRIEKITYFPSPTLVELQITAEDMHDLAGVQPFALTTEDLPKYQIDYVGKEKVDELNTYVFTVKPKQFVKGERYFEGRMWVDDQDLQVVKAQGQAVPEVGNQKFPHFESYRENIDGKYWFPTYIYADDVLDFKKGPSVHLRMTVRFTNYKKFGGRIKVLDDVDVNDEENKRSNDKSKTPPNPKKPPATSEEPNLKHPGDRP